MPAIRSRYYSNFKFFKTEVWFWSTFFLKWMTYAQHLNSPDQLIFWRRFVLYRMRQNTLSRSVSSECYWKLMGLYMVSTLDRTKILIFQSYSTIWKLKNNVLKVVKVGSKTLLWLISDALLSSFTHCMVSSILRVTPKWCLCYEYKVVVFQICTTAELQGTSV